MNKRAAQKLQRRQNIIDAAKELFLQKSIQDVQLQDVAKAVDIGIATLYRYFKNKEQLIFAVNNVITAQMLQAIETIYEQPMSGYAQIEKVFDYYVQLTDDSEHQFVKFIKAFEGYQSTIEESDELADYITIRRRMASTLLKIVARGREDGSLRTDIDLDMYIMTTVQNISTFMTESSSAVHDAQLNVDMAPKKQMLLLKDMFLQYVRANR